MTRASLDTRGGGKTVVDGILCASKRARHTSPHPPLFAAGDLHLSGGVWNAPRFLAPGGFNFDLEGAYDSGSFAVYPRC